MPLSSLSTCLLPQHLVVTRGLGSRAGAPGAASAPTGALGQPKEFCRTQDIVDDRVYGLAIKGRPPTSVQLRRKLDGVQRTTGLVD